MLHSPYHNSNIKTLQSPTCSVKKTKVMFKMHQMASSKTRESQVAANLKKALG